MAENYNNIPDWTSIPTQEKPSYEVKWWEPQSFPWQLVKELRRRNNSNNIGQVASTQSSLNFKDEWEKYKGPMVPWVRVFSNGTGNIKNAAVPRSKYLFKNGQPKKYNGFLLEGGHGFANAYGFNPITKTIGDEKAIIGYEANGTPHYIDNRYKLDGVRYDATVTCQNGQTPKFPQKSISSIVLPPPGISSVSITTSKAFISTATINWKCYGLAQLEYMTPFFLSPRLNVFLEFGWNLFDNKSLVNLNDENECYGLITSPIQAFERYYQSLGNYGLITGIIWKYNYSTQDGFIYDCKTEIISRQALYSMWRIDDGPMVVDLKNKDNDNTFLSVKNFIKTYLTYGNKIAYKKINFLKFFDINNQKSFSEEIQKDIIKRLAKEQNVEEGFFEKLGFVDEDKAQQRERIKRNVDKQFRTLSGNFSKTSFYDGKPEDRIFTGRNNEEKKPGYKEMREKIVANNNFTTAQQTEKIANESYFLGMTYGKIPPLTDAYSKENFELISFFDSKTDFDKDEQSDEKIWFRLDFVFEMINLFCADESTKRNKIDISNIKISAHPNLISCDPNVLIPNSIAPKINMGNLNNNNSGFLSDVSNDEKDNLFFVDQAPCYNFLNYTKKQEDEYIKSFKVEDKIEDCIDENKSDYKPKSLWKAFLKTKKVFKTLVASRDNLDIIINKKFYDSPNNNKPGSASFPQKEPDIDNKYNAYYYGYLKHLYISKQSLEAIASDESVKNLYSFINKVLDTINNSVDNYWKLEVIPDLEGGGLTIIDRNLSLPKKTKIYMFDIASDRNCLKQISFDVNLSKEQANSIIFEVGQNSVDMYKKITETSNNQTYTKLEKITKLTSFENDISNITYEDRFDERILKELTAKAVSEVSKSSGSLDNSTGGTAHGVVEDNPIITKLQTYGEQSDVLVMCTKFVYGNVGQSFLLNKVGNITQFRNWIYLNFPPSLKPQLKQILDDSDTLFNTPKYGSAADNFTMTLTFDGIFGFTMFQHFAISNLPKPYVPGNVIFMVTEVDHQISNGKWETVVKALLRSANNSEPYEYITI